MKLKFFLPALLFLFVLSSYAQNAKQLKLKHSDVTAPLREMMKRAANKQKEKKGNYNVPNKIKKEKRDFGTQRSSNQMLLNEASTLSISQPEVY